MVESGYGHLFAAGGMFQLLLTAVLTIYIAIIAYGLLFGRFSLSLSALAPRLVVIGLVLTFATSWPAYQAVVFDLLARGPDQIVSAFAGRTGGETRGFAMRLDGTVTQLEDAANAVDPQDVGAGNPVGHLLKSQASMAAALIRASGFLLVLGTLGVLIVARILLAAMLAVGPVFVILALFAVTRGLFFGWLRTSAMFALVPLIVVLSGAVGLQLFDPLIAAVTADPTAAAANLEPAGALLLAALIDFALTLAGLFGAAALVRAWHPASSQDQSQTALQSDAPRRGFNPVPTAVASVAAPDDDRLVAIVGAMSRQNVPSAMGSVTRAEIALPPPAMAAANDHRVVALGRTGRLQIPSRLVRKP